MLGLRGHCSVQRHCSHDTHAASYDMHSLTRSLMREERVRVYSSVFELINNVKYPARAIHMYGG